MSSKPADEQPAAKTANTAPPAPAQPAQQRLRVLAWPIEPDVKPQWLGVFVNVDEMKKEIKAFLSASGHCGLLHVATFAGVVRQELLEEGQTFTFEIVMSHRSMIGFMREAWAYGYRVYLSFVATDDPAINIDRVHRRVLQGGHPVADEKVIDLSHKSIALMTKACKVAHGAYISDSSRSKRKRQAEATDLETIRLEASVIGRCFLDIGLRKTSLEGLCASL